MEIGEEYASTIKQLEINSNADNSPEIANLIKDTAIYTRQQDVGSPDSMSLLVRNIEK